MKTRFTRVLARTIILFVTSLIASHSARAQITGSPCQCDDVPNLIKLLVRHHVAIDKLEQLRGTVELTDLFTDTMPDPNPTRTTKGENLLKTLRDAINSAAPDQTPDFNSPCIKAMEELRTSFHNSNLKNVQAGVILLRTYIQLEKDTFVRSAAEIIRRINSMDNCRPADWFGTITVHETRRHAVTDRQPATDRHNLGGETNQTDTYVRTGVIPVGRSDMIASWQVAGTLTRTDVHNSMHDCDTRGGEQFVNLVSFRTERREVITRTGSEPFKMEVSPGELEYGRKLQVSFPIPEIPVLADVSVSDTGVGGCPGEAYSKPESATGLPSTVGPEDIAFEGSIVPGGPLDPRKVSGSVTIDLVPGGFSVPGTTLTHTVRVTYNLYKVKTSLNKPPRGLRRR